MESVHYAPVREMSKVGVLGYRQAQIRNLRFRLWKKSENQIVVAAARAAFWWWSFLLLGSRCGGILNEKIEKSV